MRSGTQLLLFWMYGVFYREVGSSGLLFYFLRNRQCGLSVRRCNMMTAEPKESEGAVVNAVPFLGRERPNFSSLLKPAP
jgi:hypothetical protein